MFSNNEKTSDLILSRKPVTWDAFFQLLEKNGVPADFLSKEDRNVTEQNRDPFADFDEMLRMSAQFHNPIHHFLLK